MLFIVYYSGDVPIRRPQKSQQSPSKGGPNINEAITAQKVQLIDANGENKGQVPLAEALAAASSQSLDLVEISPNDAVPVCKVMDYGRYRFQQQRKASEARKKQKTVAVKEIKMRPNIDTHDYEVKMRNLRRFLNAGDKVKVTLRFRGREMAHQDLGMDLLLRVKEETRKFAKVEYEPKREGRQIMMVLNVAPGMSGKIDVKGAHEEEKPEETIESDDQA